MADPVYNVVQLDDGSEVTYARTTDNLGKGMGGIEPRDPVKENIGSGTGRGRLTPTCPTSISCVNLRAAAPERGDGLVVAALSDSLCLRADSLDNSIDQFDLVGTAEHEDRAIVATANGHKARFRPGPGRPGGPGAGDQAVGSGPNLSMSLGK